MRVDAGAFAEFAETLADTSGPIVLEHWRQPVDVVDKADASPVTVADRSAEAAMRQLIESRYPDHGIAGEEYGRVRLDRDHVWSLDPIDGTRAFISGSPLFGTLIALLYRNQPVLGVIDVPATRERWVGGVGLETRMNGVPTRVRRGIPLAAATCGSTSPAMFTAGDRHRINRIHDQVKLAIWGGDCYLYGLLALGRIDLVIESGLSDYDYLAPAAIVTAAGGVISDWQGRPLGIGSTNQVVAAGDPRLHDEVLRILDQG